MAIKLGKLSLWNFSNEQHICKINSFENIPSLKLDLLNKKKLSFTE